MMKARKIMNLAVLFSLLIFAFTTWGVSASARIFPEPVIYEVIRVHDYLRGSQGVLIRVESGGCTNPSQFAFEIQRDASLIAKVQVLRIKNDLCLRYMPFGLWIYFDFKEMGLRSNENFEITNPDPGAAGERIFPGLN